MVHGTKEGLAEKKQQFSEALAKVERKRKKKPWHHLLVFVKNHSRHSALFLVGAIVLISNLISEVNLEVVAEGEWTSFEGQTVDVPTKEKDISEAVKAIAKFTPLIKENPNKVAVALSEEITLALAADGYVSKPRVLGVAIAKTSTDSSAISNRRLMNTYMVKRGENLGSIANKFGLKTTTLKDCNNLSNINIIQPGKKLLIPPRDGLVHRVGRGQNLISLISYYKGSLGLTKKLNRLGDGDSLYVGQRIFVADGRKPPLRLAQRSSTPSNSYSSSYSRPTYSRPGYNHFPYGWCTWYVASRRYVPWRGNGNQWAYNAQRSGYATGRTPKVGAILVTFEPPLGHVAYVEAVHGNTITVSEMNYVGWGRVSRRTLSAWRGVYIY